MKKLTIIIALVLTAALAKAQSTDKVALGFVSDFAIPYNAETYGYTFGGGFGAKFEWQFIPGLKLTFSPAYFVASSTDRNFYYFLDQAHLIIHDPRPHTTYKFLPVKAGLKFFYLERAYFEVQAGESFKVSSITEKSVVYSAGTGGILPIDHHNYFDIGFHYERGLRNNDFYDGASSQIDLKFGYLHSF